MAVTADSVVVELVAKTDGYTAAINGAANASASGMSKIEQSASKAEAQVQQSAAGMGASVKRAANDIDAGARQAGFATRNLSFQISDVGQQLGGGQSPFVVFAQQAPQFAQAFEDIAASGAKIGTVLSGIAVPGVLALISILGTLIAQHYAASDATDKHTKAADDLAEAEKRLNSAAADEIHTTRQGIIDDINRANSLRVREIQTRKTLQAELELAKAKSEEAGRRAEDPTLAGEGGFNGGAVAQATFSRQSQQLEGQIAQQNAKIASAQKAIAVGASKLILRDVAGATNAATKATQNYEDRLDSLQRKFQSGGFGAPQSRAARQELERLTLAATRQRDVELDAAKATQTRASRSLAGGRGGKAAADIYTTSDLLAALSKDLRGIDQQFDKLFVNGKDFTDRARAQFRSIFGEEGKDYEDPFGGVKGYNEQERGAASERSQQEQRLQSQREGNVRSLASLYEDLFTEGTGRVFDNFKREGLRAVALILAQATISSFGKGGGGIGSFISNIGSAASSIFGGGSGSALPKLASGGSFRAGGVSGVDQNVLSINGQPRAMVGAHELVTVSPNTAAARGAGGTTVVSAPQFNLRGAIITRELYADMQRISDESAARAGQASYKQALRDAPGAVQRARRFGST